MRTIPSGTFCFQLANVNKADVICVGISRIRWCKHELGCAERLSAGKVHMIPGFKEFFHGGHSQSSAHAFSTLGWLQRGQCQREGQLPGASGCTGPEQPAEAMQKEAQPPSLRGIREPWPSHLLRECCSVSQATSDGSAFASACRQDVPDGRRKARMPQRPCSKGTWQLSSERRRS